MNSGFAIYDTMRFIKSEVRVVCTGLTASIATVMLLGLQKNIAIRCLILDCSFINH